MSALAADPAVGAVALAVDLVPEYDEDDSYPQAALAVAAATDKPVAVLASVPAAIDQRAAARLRAAGVPVLESTRFGLLALRHLLAPPLAAPPARAAAARHVPPNTGAVTAGRPGSRAARPALSLLDLLRDYGIPAARAASASTLDGPGRGGGGRLPGRAEDRPARRRAQDRRRRRPPGRGWP